MVRDTLIVTNEYKKIFIELLYVCTSLDVCNSLFEILVGDID